MESLDELGIYRGRDIPVTDKISLRQPTIDEIEQFGEELYFKTMQTFTSVGADLKWQLWDYYHIDYTKISDYELFVKYICHWVSSGKNIYKEFSNHPDKYENEIKDLSEEKVKKMLINPMKLVLGDIDFADFVPMKKKYSEDNEQIVLYNPYQDILIDKLVYSQLVGVIRKMHGFKRNNEMPMNERTKLDLIEDARDEALYSPKKSFKSIILPILSTLELKTGADVWNYKINKFFYNARRLGIIKESELLLQGAYAGFTNLKDVDKDKLDMYRVIDMD